MSGGADRPQDAEHIELLWPVVPKGDVDGALNWISGVMALDVSHEVWQRLRDAPPAEREPALLAYAHELCHWFQLATLGFLHDWAAQLFDLIRPVVKREEAAFGPGDFAPVKRLVREGSARLAEAERQALAAHFRKLDAPSRSGLTVRALCEGHAYFVERRIAYVMQRPSDWTPHLQQAPAPLYRVAFDALALLAGYGVAYEWFAAVASVALCCESPVAAYERLALALAHDEAAQAKQAGPGTAREMVLYLQRQLPGLPLNTPLEGPGALHPIFSGAASGIRQAMADGHCDPYLLLARPDLQILDLARRDGLEPPIVFRPAAASRLAFQVSRGLEEGALLAVFTLGAVGHRLTQDAERAARAEGARQIESLSWLVRDHTVVLFRLAAEDLRTGSPDRMVAILGPNPGAEEATRLALWGRVALQLPVEIDPSGDANLAERSDVRRLFRAIHARLPSFPVYLASEHALYDWFGSIAPEAARGPRGVNLEHPDVQVQVGQALGGIEEHARAVGVNPWLAIQALFKGYFDLPPVE